METNPDDRDEQQKLGPYYMLELETLHLLNSKKGDQKA
jgi:hypothetical protein